MVGDYAGHHFKHYHFRRVVRQSFRAAGGTDAQPDIGSYFYADAVSDGNGDPDADVLSSATDTGADGPRRRLG